MADLVPWQIFAAVVGVCAILIIIWFNWRHLRKCSYAMRGKKAPKDIEDGRFKGDEGIQS